MVIRNWERTVLGLVTTTAFAGFVAFATVRHPASDSLVGGAVIEALLIVLAVRVWRAGALVTDDRLVVRNVLRSHAVPWSEVAAFSPAWDDPRLHSAGVTTVDGRRLSCTAMRPMAGWDLVNGPLFAERAAQSGAASLLAAAVERHRPAAEADHAADDRATAYQSRPGLSTTGTSAWVGANSPDGDGTVDAGV